MPAFEVVNCNCSLNSILVGLPQVSYNKCLCKNKWKSLHSFTGMVHTQQDVQRVDLWHVRAPLTVDLGNLHVTHVPWWWTFLPCYIRILWWMVTFWTKHAFMDPHCDSYFTSLQAGSPSAWNHVFNALLLETDTVSVSPTFL